MSAMSEWLKYGLADFRLGSPYSWYPMLDRHYVAWWPLQPVFMLCGLALLLAIYRGKPWALSLGLALMGFAHLIVAWGFFTMRYAELEPGVWYLSIAFGAQGVLLIALAAIRRDFVTPQANWATRVGGGLIGFAVFLYPVLDLAVGLQVIRPEWFAAAPDPTVMATLGTLLFVSRCRQLQHPRRTWLLLSLWPLLWCAIAGANLYRLDAFDYWVLPAAGLLALGIGWWQSGLRWRHGRSYPSHL